MFMLNMTDQRKVEPFPYLGKESGNRFMQLLYRAIAEKKIDYEKAAELAETTEQEIKEGIFTNKGNQGIIIPISCG